MVQTINAVVVRSSKGAQLLDYLNALKSIISPSDILEAGSRGPQFFAFFLKDENVMTRLIEKKTIEVNGASLQIEPFIANIKTITFKPVPPHICDAELMAHLNSKGKVIKQIEKVTYGYFPAEWSHVFSFTRRVVMQIQDPASIPASVTVRDADGRAYTVYLECGGRKCQKCGSTKHPTSKCNSTPNPTNTAAPANNKPQERTTSGSNPGSSQVSAENKQRPRFMPSVGTTDHDSETGTQSDGFQTQTGRKKARKKKLQQSPPTSSKKSRDSGTTPPEMTFEPQGRNIHPYPFANPIAIESYDIDTLLSSNDDQSQIEINTNQNMEMVESDTEDKTQNESEVEAWSEAETSQSQQLSKIYTYPNVNLHGPINSEEFKKAIEFFISKRSYKEAVYFKTALEHGMSNKDFKIMVNNLKQEVPVGDDLHKCLKTMLIKWPKKWRTDSNSTSTPVNSK